MSQGIFHSFVILADMRTGSNFLEANLNALPGVTSHGEVFNPHFIGKKDATELFGITLADRDLNPKPLLRKLRDKTDGLSGFRFFHDHDPRVLDLVLEDPGCAKIVLTRNPVDSYVSWLIARTTGQWKLTDARRLKTATARFDAAEFQAHLAAVQGFQLQVLKALQTSGQTAFVLDYEDLASVEVLNGLAAFLGVEGRLKAVDDTLKKQNPEPLEAKLENPQDLAPALARADLFALARTPVFEPRRPPAIPTAVAAAGAPLLFFPVRAAPDATIRRWLSGLGGLVDGFDNRSLRQWKRAHPGHRAFTVIRHPLLRAHVAFRERIVSGQLSDHRRTLVRAFKACLPEPGQPFPDARSEHEAFLVFLHYCRLATSGQTGQRVDSSWASQTAILQGFAGFQPLDLVIREDRLAQSLAFLAAEAGLPPPPLPAPDPAASALDAIYDESLENAAEAAYSRDYMGFGFGRWRDQTGMTEPSP
jgi:LPS sulfotransferase NodH